MTVILLVEDDPDQVALLRRAFEKTVDDLDLVVAADGPQALALFAHGHRFATEFPRLVLLDVGLPGIDGIGVLRVLRTAQRTRKLPVVVWTASDSGEDRAACGALGAAAYVRKPLDGAELTETIRGIARTWLA
jgi:CheY-like chemotaxis protein